MTALGSLTTFNQSPNDTTEKTEFLKLSDTNNDYEMSVWLYGDTAFSTWAAGVDDSTKSPTENEKEFATDYSDYVLRIFCNVTKVATFDYNSNRAESGCCLRDESQKGGGYCVKLAANQSSVTTVFLTEAMFETVLATPYDLTSITTPQNAHEGITTFFVVSKGVTSNLWDSWYAYKAQPWPAASWSEMYRFEKGDKATGLIYNSPADGSAKWLDETKTLVGAYDAIRNASMFTAVFGLLAMSLF